MRSPRRIAALYAGTAAVVTFALLAGPKALPRLLRGLVAFFFAATVYRLTYRATLRLGRRPLKRP